MLCFLNYCSPSWLKLPRKYLQIEITQWMYYFHIEAKHEHVRFYHTDPIVHFPAAIKTWHLCNVTLSFIFRHEYKHCGSKLCYLFVYMCVCVCISVPMAQRDREPLYQFWVGYLGVISHVGHQLAKKPDPLWDTHLFSALGRAQSQRAAGMKRGWAWEGPAEKTRVGGSIRTQPVWGTPAVHSYSNAASPSLPVCIRLRRSEADRCTGGSRLGCLTHACILSFMPTPLPSLSVC